MDVNQQHDRFVEQFVRSQDRIYAYVVTLLPNRADAEEVFQQTSLLLWKKWQQFDPSRDFVRWGCGMAHLEVANFLRKHRDRGRIYPSEEVLAGIAQTRLEQNDMLEDDAATPCGACFAWSNSNRVAASCWKPLITRESTASRPSRKAWDSRPMRST